MVEINNHTINKKEQDNKEFHILLRRCVIGAVVIGGLVILTPPNVQTKNKLEATQHERAQNIAKHNYDSSLSNGLDTLGCMGIVAAIGVAGIYRVYRKSIK